METGKKAVIGSRKTKDVRTVTVDTEFRASDTHKATPAPTAGKKRKKKKKAETNDVQCATACQASEFSDHHKNSIVSERQSKGEFAASWSPTPFYDIYNYNDPQTVLIAVQGSVTAVILVG